MDKFHQEVAALAVEALKKAGYPWQAKYIEKFGLSLDPGMSWRGSTKGTERFYKMCVEEGHPWDWYHDYPDDAIF